MLHLADNLVAEIVGNIYAGWNVFVHKQTHKLAMYVADSSYLEPDEEEYLKVQQNPNNYLQIFPMTDYETYSIVENFINNVGIDALNKELDKYKGQLGNLRRAIQNSNYSEKWYSFLRNAQMAHTKEQLEGL